MIMFFILSGGIALWRGIAVQRWKLRWKILASVIVLMIAGKFYILRLFSGSQSVFNPELPPSVLLPSAWLFALLMFFCIWLVGYDLLKLVSWLICRLRKKKQFRFFTVPLWRLAGLIPAAILVSIGLYEGLKVPEVTSYTLKFKDLPESLSGFRIVHLADLHADPVTRAEKIVQIVKMVNDIQADLVVITGDFVDGKTDLRGKDLAALSELEAKSGVYGVPGNHEYYSGYQSWMTLLEKYGVNMLTNRHVMITDQLALGGVTDPAAARVRKGEVEFEKPDVKKAFADAPAGSFKMLLAHQPKLASEAAENKVDLQLSGHTHGGMIWGMDMLVAAFNNGWVSGEYDVGSMKLFISNGTGIWGGFPIRLGRRSEIAVITLERE